jgi:DNA invertase Pin-like site-specific DNA recombinase
MARVGYARVSTDDQHPEVQEDRLVHAGCEKVFTDRGVSGKLARRPQWDVCLAYIRPGDVLVTVRLDRIGRSVRNLLDVVADLEERNIDLVCLDQGGVDTTTPMGKMLFVILGAVAQFERDLIRERTRDGLAAARARGRKGGRKVKLSPGQVAHARQLYEARQHTVQQIADLLGVDRRTIYRSLERESKSVTAPPGGQSVTPG